MTLSALVTKLISAPRATAKAIRIETLLKFLLLAKDRYFNSEEPLVEDSVFDICEVVYKERASAAEWRKYDAKIGAPIDSNKSDRNASQRKATLPFKMPSVQKVRPDMSNVQELIDNMGSSVLLSDKLDGFSLLLTYSPDGVKAYTRGNGAVGQDVSFIVPMLNVPQKLNKELAVRGEVAVSKAKFEQLRKQSDNPESFNLRNYTNGISTSKDPSAKLKHALFIAHEVLSPKVRPDKGLNQLDKLKFKTVRRLVVKNPTVKKLSDFLTKRKTSSKFDIDGLVLASLSNRSNGTYDKLAFKTLDDQEFIRVTVIDVEWTESRTGLMAPVIIYKPTRINGVMNSRCTIYNAKWVQTLGIGPGAVIEIIRSGDVIPRLQRVVKKDKPKLPKGNFKWSSTGTHLISIDKSDSRVIKELVHLFSVLGVEGLKYGTMESLVSEGLDTPKKVLNAKLETLLSIEGIGSSKAQNIVKSMTKLQKGMPAADLAYASGAFTALGSTLIAALFDTYPKAVTSIISEEDLLAVPGFSDTRARNAYLGLKKFHKFLKIVPIPALAVIKRKRKAGVLQEEYIAFTGVRDKELALKLENKGATVTNGLTKQTTILVVPDKNYTSSKVSIAKKRKIKILTIDEVKTLL